MDLLRIVDSDLEETFVLGSGPGGQKINKTSSCVSLRHLPSSIEIQCQEGRSQAHNRILARIRLCDKLEDAKREQERSAARERALVRFQKRRRSKAMKAKILDLKRQRSEKKARRSRVND
ncbi:MAG: peptide chain release factor-like protein [Verrucomicrobiales bacterium]